MVPLPIVSISRPGLDGLLLALEVAPLDVRECFARERRIAMEPADCLFLFYSKSGSGRLLSSDSPPAELAPQTFAIVHPSREIQIEAATQSSITFIQARLRTSLGGLIDPFALLTQPVVEQLSCADRLDSPLNWALEEFLARQVGAEAVIGSVLKLILVSAIRRSVAAGHSWVESLVLLEDRRIGSVLNNMMATPGAPHSIQTLAEASHMSRSAFIARFTSVVGHSPMSALRRLRMRRAALLLTNGGRSIEKVARHVGYSSRSSFVRAFVDTFGTHPGAYRSGVTGDMK